MPPTQRWSLTPQSVQEHMPALRNIKDCKVGFSFHLRNPDTAQKMLQKSQGGVRKQHTRETEVPHNKRLHLGTKFTCSRKVGTMRMKQGGVEGPPRDDKLDSSRSMISPRGRPVHIQGSWKMASCEGART